MEMNMRNKKVHLNLMRDSMDESRTCRKNFIKDITLKRSLPKRNKNNNNSNNN